MKTVDQETLRNWLGDTDLFLMDVRSTSARNRSIAKIEHSHRFEPEKFGKMAQDIPKNKKLVLYCEDGKTNCPNIAKELEKMGFTKLYLLEGGFRGWRGKEFPAVPKELR
jgi:rhodanese-related sulfurtransferase